MRYFTDSRDSRSIEAMMRTNGILGGAGQFAKDGRRVRPRAFKSAQRVRSQGQREQALVRTRLTRYGFKLADLQRVAQIKGRPSNVDSLLRHTLEKIVYTECQSRAQKLSMKAVADVLGIRQRSVQRMYRRAEAAYKAEAFSLGVVAARAIATFETRDEEPEPDEEIKPSAAQLAEAGYDTTEPAGAYRDRELPETA